ncbi:FadR family transcriptional regulator [Catenovulum sp. 2E275]|uniref:FadR/GntR family transcriptional regulator n=1 Tax=Catenovulum sp. 2E275 TaxID=2980497 RepID=UPI0021D287E7|nr:FadR/GntR family transcriptional regulator [Catenovulum sp. 2E275]MCU4676109.1 FadR family transcriptional regulator [Catenovulum sp. 2E275]
MFQFEGNLNLSQRMTHELGKAIVRGQYSEVGGLPTEAELCDEFGISRSAMREAVKMLSAKGLITSRPRQGIRILPEDQWNIFDSDVLKWILESNPSLELLKEFLQMRMAIEPEAAALAAKNAQPQDIEAIGKAVDRMIAAKNGLDDPLQSDIAFHISILYASRNRFFIQLREFVQTALNVSIRHTNQLKGITVGDIEDHSAIYYAIKAGDAVKAEAAVKHMIDEAQGLIESALKQEK